MHTQQLGNPLLYSLLWLRQVHRAGDIVMPDVSSVEVKDVQEGLQEKVGDEEKGNGMQKLEDTQKDRH